MNGFAIEVAAETNPFSQSALQQTLQKAASSDINQIQSSTKQLQQWETTSGYYSALQNVYIQEALPSTVRMLALIQLKNGIDKYWRKSATNAINSEERSSVREKLLQSTLLEAADNLATLNAVVTAKVARHDFPGQWPNLIKELVDLIKTSVDPQRPPKQLSRALLISHHIIKELSTVRLQRARASLQSAAPALFDTLKDCYIFQSQQWQTRLANHGGDLDISLIHLMDTSEQTLKILRRLVLTGWEFPHRDPEITAFWTMTATQLQHYLDMLHQSDLQHAYRMSASRHAKQISKLHLNMAKDHPISFPLFQDTTQLVQAYWSAAKILRRRQLESTQIDEDMSGFYDDFNLRAILIVRACFKEAFNLMQPFKYRNSDGKDEPPRARKVLSESLLTKDFVNDLFQVVVSQFFIYIQTDVEEFITEPEEWDMKDEGNEEAYERSVRAAAERLFMDITLHHKDIVIDPLLSTTSSLSNTTGPNATLMKDAVYAAIGVAAPILYTKFDFNSFLRSNLVPDLNETDPMFSIVRRRIAIVLARWVPVDISDENRPLAYEIFQTLLDRSTNLNNAAVRITAGKRLNDVVDEIAFKSEVFSPYASQILKELMDLIGEVKQAETKLALLNTISTVVERMDSQVSPFAGQLVQLLEALWANAAEQNMIKTVIVTILQKLVTGMKGQSAPLHGAMLQIIRAAVEPGSDSQVYLLDDALDLWLAILKNTTDPPPSDLLSLLPYLTCLYDLDDAMHKSLMITKSYILLAPSEVMRENMRQEIFKSFVPLLTVRDVKVPIAVAESVGLMLRAAEILGGEEAVHLVSRDLVQSSFLPHAMESLLLSWEARQTTGPKRKDPPTDWKNETDYICIISRTILLSMQAFLNVVMVFSESKQLPLDAFMSRFLEECFAHMDAIGRPSDSKLVCLALTKLLETGESWILGKLQDLMALWTSMITELRDGEDDKDGDTLVYTEPPNATTTVPEDQRTRALSYSDPVHTINLGHFVRHHLQNAVATVGGDSQFQNLWLANVDKEVIKAFGELGLM